MPIETYWRKIWPVHEVDGDTSDVLEDDGRRAYAVRRERDLGIDTPEMHAADPLVRARAAQAAIYRRAWFEEHIACNTLHDSWPRVDGQLFAGYVEIPYFLLDSRKPDSFDRWLSLIECQAGHSLADALLQAGLADPRPR